MKDYEAFKLAVRQRESSNNYRCVNTLGYLGAYQFGMARLCDLGLTRRKDPESKGFSNDLFAFSGSITKDIFLNSPHLQDITFDMHVHRLKNLLLKKYPSISTGIMVLNGTFKLELSGGIMVCHLVGPGALDDLIHCAIDDKDAFGTKASDYAKLFAGFNIPC